MRARCRALRTPTLRSSNAVQTATLTGHTTESRTMRIHNEHVLDFVKEGVPVALSSLILKPITKVFKAHLLRAGFENSEEDHFNLHRLHLHHSSDLRVLHRCP